MSPKEDVICFRVYLYVYPQSKGYYSVEDKQQLMQSVTIVYTIYPILLLLRTEFLTIYTGIHLSRVRHEGVQH